MKDAFLPGKHWEKIYLQNIHLIKKIASGIYKEFLGLEEGVELQRNAKKLLDVETILYLDCGRVCPILYINKIH